MALFPLVLLAAAQAASPSAGAAAGMQQPMQVFISPSGEPFRAPVGQPYPVAQWFAEADANHDGKLTSTEFMVDFMKFFDSLDVNHDRQLDAGEIARYEREIAPEVARGGRGGPGRADRENGGDWRGHHGRGHRGGGFGGEGMPGGGGFSSRHFQDMDEGGGGQEGDDSHSGYGGEIGSYHSGGPDRQEAVGGARFDLLGIPEPVSDMAHDLSGVVYRQDALNAATQRFDALDGKGLGFLTLATLPETMAQRHKGKWKR
ncbi:MAG: hypothetical protein KGL48_11930 [Sphingomonadales bacterium]|nr:hypothetical protein [Sphingomonadales bacterium]MDE2568293.1 hypothetical protein [Sphingomonadales bacterium]